MTTQKTMFQTVAKELADSFVSFTRDGDETTQYKIKDDAPAWLKEKDSQYQGFSLRVHRALDDRFPDDWVYSIMAHGADSLAEYDDADAARDAMGEIADGLVDVYNNDRHAWLASHLLNASLVDEAVEEFGHSDQGVCGDIAAGQFMAIERIINAMIEEIDDEASSRDE